MKKVGLLIFTLLIFWVSACDDDAPDYPDTKLIKGQWQLVEDGAMIIRLSTVLLPAAKTHGRGADSSRITFCRTEQPISINDIHGTSQILRMKKTENRVLNSLGMTLPTVTIYGMQRNIISS